MAMYGLKCSILQVLSADMQQANNATMIVLTVSTEISDALLCLVWPPNI